MPRKSVPKKHRHFVAAPLAALIVSISLLDGVLPTGSQAPELSASVMKLSEGEVFRLPQGKAMLYSGQGFTVSPESIVFENGSALVSTEGFLEFAVAGKKVSTVSGAFYLSYFGGDLTIAALTSPVLFRDNARLMVVPAGMQWKVPAEEKLPLLQAGYPLWQEARQVQAFPERFFVRQLQNLMFLPSEEDVLPPAGSEPLPLWTKFPALRIGATQETVEQEWREEVFGALRKHVESGDRDALDAFLHKEEYIGVLQSDEVWKVMVRLYVRAQEDSVRSLLLSQLLSDEDFWLLASLHPDFRAEVWSSFAEQKNPEAVTLRLFLLPTSNMVQQAVPADAMRRWTYELSQLAQGEKAAALVGMMVEQHLPLVSVFDQMGYPERSRVLVLSLKKLVENTGVTLRQELTSELSALTSFDRMSLEELPPMEEQVLIEEEVKEEEKEVVPAPVVEVKQEEAVEVSSYSPDVVERRAYTVLRDIGALFTVETTIDAVAPNTAQVRSIIFSGKSGDRTVDFHFDVAKGEIRQVILGNKEYPYSLTVEAFRDWIQK